MAVLKLSNSADMLKDAVVLDLGDLRRQGEAIMAQARERAAATVKAGEAERARLIADAAAVGRAEGLEQGKAEGFARGLEEGRAAGLAERREALERLDRTWSESLGAFTAARERLLDEAGRDVVLLAARLAERVVKRAIALDPSIVQDQLRAVLGLVMRPSRVSIRIHPDDRALATDALPGIVAALGTVAHAEIEGDPSLARGSCVARLRGAAAGDGLPGGEIDASIDTQLARLAEALLPAVSECGRADAGGTSVAEGDETRTPGGDPARDVEPTGGGDA